MRATSSSARRLAGWLVRNASSATAGQELSACTSTSAASTSSALSNMAWTMHAGPSMLSRAQVSVVSQGGRPWATHHAAASGLISARVFSSSGAACSGQSSEGAATGRNAGPAGNKADAAQQGADQQAGASTDGASASEAGNGKEGDSASGSGSDSEAPRSAEELLADLKGKEETVAKLTAQVEKLTDALKRSLAEMENLRTRTAKEVDSAKKFALQKFVKSLLDVPDNLERACSVVPPEALAEGGGVPPEKLRATLKGLVEGVQAVESILLKVLSQHGVTRYDPLGEKFDPNLHAALYEVPDPSKEAGTVHSVTKRGYMLNDRVIRPAEVGVVRH